MGGKILESLKKSALKNPSTTNDKAAKSSSYIFKGMDTPELKIKQDFEDNSIIIFLISQ